MVEIICHVLEGLVHNGTRIENIHKHCKVINWSDVQEYVEPQLS